MYRGFLYRIPILENSGNKQMMTNMKRVLKPGGWLLLSTLVDARYESARYGKDQEKAPIIKHRSWETIGEEGLRRWCFTVPYYKQLITRVGFRLMAEFDIEEGKRYNPIDRDPMKSIRYRRWLCHN